MLHVLEITYDNDAACSSFYLLEIESTTDAQERFKQQWRKIVTTLNYTTDGAYNMSDAVYAIRKLGYVIDYVEEISVDIEDFDHDFWPDKEEGDA